MWENIEQNHPNTLPEEEEDDETARITLASDTELWCAFTTGNGNNLYQNNSQDYAHNKKLLCAMSYIIQHHIPEGVMMRLHSHITQPSNLFDSAVRNANNICKH